jgi:hypothetical protein
VVRPTDAFDICHEVYAHARELLEHKLGTIHPEASGKYMWRPDVRPKLAEFVADFCLAGQRALSRSGGTSLASRLALFRVYYCGGAEYHAARKHLGISELTWSVWSEEVRERVGRELLRSGLFPPGRYFREPSAAKLRQGRYA